MSVFNQDFRLLKKLITFRDNCIQNFHLGMYIVGYKVGNLVLPQHVNVVSDCISVDIPPQMKFCIWLLPFKCTSAVSSQIEAMQAA